MSTQLEIPLTVNGMSCIYALIDPRTHKVRYVGKSDDPTLRLWAHLHNESRPNTHKSRWIRQLVSEGFTPQLVILERVKSEDWQTAEIKWIAHFRKAGSNLTNSTNGGDGFDSEWVKARWLPSSEAALKRVEAMRGRKPDQSKRPTTSKHVGVSKSRDGRFRAFRAINGKRLHFGYFKTEEEAVAAREKAESENRTTSITKPKGVRIPRVGREGMQGVTKSKKRWRSFFNINGKQTVLGSFITFEEAMASRKAAEAGSIVIQAKPAKRPPKLKPEPRYDMFGTRLGRGRHNTSGAKGVSFIPQRNRWQAYIDIDGKRKSLGKFQTFESAAAARKTAEQQLT